MPGSAAEVNLAHRVYCGTGHWARGVEGDLMPWALDGAELGEEVLEIGPGLGATTKVLAERLPGRLTVIELQHSSVERLRERFAPTVDVVEGDATAMPFEDGRFSGAACFTMLHHVPTPELQDRLLAEACRVLHPGGQLTGTDSLGGGLAFRLLHIADTFVPLDPATLPARLEAAGFSEPEVELRERRIRFRARKPG
jgi:SAM-dependent methyltransferase